MAGLVGIEPTHGRIKIFCLTAWLQANMVDRGGFEPPKQMWLIYSQLRLATSLPVQF